MLRAADRGAACPNSSRRRAESKARSQPDHRGSKAAEKSWENSPKAAGLAGSEARAVAPRRGRHERALPIQEKAQAGRRLAGYLGKRASGITFWTGAEGGGGFQNARNAIPPSSSRAITMTNATV